MKNTIVRFVTTALLAAAAVSCALNPAQSGSGENEAVKNMLERKSVRSYTQEQVTDAQVTTMLKAAMAAPSGSDVRPWSFVVLRDASRYDSVFAGNGNMSKFKSASAVVVICADTTVMRVPKGAPRDSAPVQMPNGTWRDDMGAVTENLLLAAESLGLGAVWTACYPYAERMNPVKAELGLPSTVVPYAVVPVGYPAGDNAPKDKWDESRIHLERW